MKLSKNVSYSVSKGVTFFYVGSSFALALDQEGNIEKDYTEITCSSDGFTLTFESANTLIFSFGKTYKGLKTDAKMIKKLLAALGPSVLPAFETEQNEEPEFYKLVLSKKNKILFEYFRQLFQQWLDDKVDINLQDLPEKVTSGLLQVKEVLLREYSLNIFANSK